MITVFFFIFLKNRKIPINVRQHPTVALDFFVEEKREIVRVVVVFQLFINPNKWCYHKTIFYLKALQSGTILVLDGWKMLNQILFLLYHEKKIENKLLYENSPEKTGLDLWMNNGQRIVCIRSSTRRRSIIRTTIMNSAIMDLRKKQTLNTRSINETPEVLSIYNNYFLLLGQGHRKK